MCNNMRLGTVTINHPVSRRTEKSRVVILLGIIPGLEVIKLFSSSAQLSMKFQLLINVEIVKIIGKFKFKTQKLVIYPAHKC